MMIALVVSVDGDGCCGGGDEIDETDETVAAELKRSMSASLMLDEELLGCEVLVFLMGVDKGEGCSCVDSVTQEIKPYSVASFKKRVPFTSLSLRRRSCRFFTALRREVPFSPNVEGWLSQTVLKRM